MEFSVGKEGCVSIMLRSLLALLLLFANLTKAQERNEQRVTLKFMVKTGFMPIECWRRLRTVWRDRTMCKTQVRFWHKRFKNGQEETDDNKRCGRPRTKVIQENIDKVGALLEAEGRLSLREVCDRTGLKMGVVTRIVKKELKLRHRAPKFMPTELTDEQKKTRKEVCEENIETLCATRDPEQWLHTIVTGDEMWINTCEQETKLQLSHWLTADAPRPKKALRIPGNKKTMLTLFCDAKGMILMDWLEPKDKIDSARYIQTLSKLKENLCQKRPELWKDRKFLLHQDNASPHTSFETMRKINKWGLQLLPHPPNSPDMAPCDFGFFPKLKAALRGCRFATIPLLQQEVRCILLSWEPHVFNNIMHNLVLRWQKCCAVQGAYFEGEHVQIDPLFAKESAEAEETESESEDDN